MVFTCTFVHIRCANEESTYLLLKAGFLRTCIWHYWFSKNYCMRLKVTKLYFFKNISGSDVLPVQPGLPPLPLVLIREVWCLSLCVIWTFLCESFLLSFSQSKYKSPIQWQVKAQGRQGEGNQSRNLLAIWSNWLFAVFAGWEAEHILYGLSCYGGWSHPPILDPRCRSPWLRAPFPCLAFLWSPRGCTPPPSMRTAGGTAQGETCLANSRASSGRKRPQPPPSSPPCLRPVLPSSQEVFPLVHEEEASSLPRGKFSAFLENLQDRKFSLRSNLMPSYPWWSYHHPCPLPLPSLGQNSAWNLVHQPAQWREHLSYVYWGMGNQPELAASSKYRIFEK